MSGLSGGGRALRSVGLAILAAAALASCCVGHFGPAVRASGKRVTETRTVPAFSRVDLAGSVKLDLAVGSPAEVVLEADDNVMPLVETSVAGGRLRVALRESVVGGDGLRVKIVTPTLEALDLSGSCSGTIRGVAGPSFGVGISGAGTLEGDGSVDRLELNVSGAGNVDFGKLSAKRVSVNVSGAGDVTVDVHESLSAKVSGVATVRYSGDPREVNRRVSGVGKVEPLR